MRLLLILFILAVILNPSQGTLIIGSPSAQPVDTRVERIAIQANGTGGFVIETDNKIIGQLVGIAWDKGNFTGAGTITIKTVLPSAVQIDTFNISPASGFRVPGLKLQGSADGYTLYTLFSRLWINGTGLQNLGSATLYLIWR
jgi:hypothetical protein